MMDSSRGALKPDERGLGDAPAKSQGKLVMALGVIAIALSLVLGFVSLTSVRRLEHEVARLNQQTEDFSRLVVRSQEQSQTLAQQASQAAANAQATCNSHSVVPKLSATSWQTGISATIMSTKGFGKSDPRVQGDSEQARAANRRVEIGIVDSKLITNGPLVVPK
jgi:hypothetical protein